MAFRNVWNAILPSNSPYLRKEREWYNTPEARIILLRQLVKHHTGKTGGADGADDNFKKMIATELGLLQSSDEQLKDLAARACHPDDIKLVTAELRARGLPSVGGHRASRPLDILPVSLSGKSAHQIHREHERKRSAWRLLAPATSRFLQKNVEWYQSDKAVRAAIHSIVSGGGFFAVCSRLYNYFVAPKLNIFLNRQVLDQSHQSHQSHQSQPNTIAVRKQITDKQDKAFRLLDKIYDDGGTLWDTYKECTGFNEAHRCGTFNTLNTTIYDIEEAYALHFIRHGIDNTTSSITYADHQAFWRSIAMLLAGENISYIEQGQYYAAILSRRFDSLHGMYMKWNETQEKPCDFTKLKQITGTCWFNAIINGILINPAANRVFSNAVMTYLEDAPTRDKWRIMNEPMDDTCPSQQFTSIHEWKIRLYAILYRRACKLIPEDTHNNIVKFAEYDTTKVLPTEWQHNSSLRRTIISVKLFKLFANVEVFYMISQPNDLYLYTYTGGAAEWSTVYKCDPHITDHTLSFQVKPPCSLLSADVIVRYVAEDDDVDVSHTTLMISGREFRREFVYIREYLIVGDYDHAVVGVECNHKRYIYDSNKDDMFEFDWGRGRSAFDKPMLASLRRHYSVGNTKIADTRIVLIVYVSTDSANTPSRCHYLKGPSQR